MPFFSFSTLLVDEIGVSRPFLGYTNTFYHKHLYTYSIGHWSAFYLIQYFQLQRLNSSCLFGYCFSPFLLIILASNLGAVLILGLQDDIVYQTHGWSSAEA